MARFIPLALIAVAMVLVYATGLYEYLSFKTIGTNYAALKDFVSANIGLALAAYIATYIAAVSLSLPGSLLLTLAGGLLFGWQIGAAATVVAATIGATILFLVARTSLGEALAAKAGPSLAALSDGFKENAMSYLLFLRLVPLFPFFIVNLAPALLGVPLVTFIVATFFGIIPGTIAFSIAGSGLGSVVEAQNAIYDACRASAGTAGTEACPYDINTSALVTPELLIAFAALGVVALIPVALKTWRGRNV